MGIPQWGPVEEGRLDDGCYFTDAISSMTWRVPAAGRSLSALAKSAGHRARAMISPKSRREDKRAGLLQIVWHCLSETGVAAEEVMVVRNRDLSRYLFMIVVQSDTHFTRTNLAMSRACALALKQMQVQLSQQDFFWQKSGGAATPALPGANGMRRRNAS
jgi:uncharacterized protein (UPF0332 family)